MSRLTRRVDGLIRANQGLRVDKRVKAVLRGLGLPESVDALNELEPVMREAVNEVWRREVMEHRRELKRDRHRPISGRGSHYRRVIITRQHPPVGHPHRKFAEDNGLVREIHVHATKGTRSYRVIP